MGAADQQHGVIHLLHAADHGQQQAQIVESDGRPQHGPHLGQKDFRMVQGDADTPPAEKGVLLLHRKIGQGLIAADIQGANDHRPRMEGLQHLAVVGHLHRLAGEAVADHEGKFRTVESDPGRLVIPLGAHLGDQAGVDIERHGETVGSLAGQAPAGFQLLGNLPVLFRQALVLLQHRGGGGDIDPAQIAVQDHVAAIHQRDRQIAQTHDGGDIHGAGEYRHMGEAGAAGGDDTGQLLTRHFGQLHGADLFAHQDGVLRVDLLGGLPLFQMHEDTSAQVTHIGGPLPQVDILHVVEDLRMLLDGLPQGAGGPVALVDTAYRLADQGVAAEHLQPGVEQGPVLGGQAVLEAVLQGHQILYHRRHGGTELILRLIRIHNLFVGHCLQVCRRVDHHGVAEGDTGGAGTPLQETPGRRRLPRGDQLSGGLGMGDGAGQLGRQGEEEGDLAIGEGAGVDLPYHQYPQHLAVLDDGHAEKTFVLDLAGLVGEEVAAVARCIGQVDRLRPFADQADQAPVIGQADLAHGLRAQTVGGHECVFAPLEIGQVNGADIHLDGLLHLGNDDPQHLIEIGGGIDLFDDPMQRVEHGRATRHLLSGGRV